MNPAQGRPRAFWRILAFFLFLAAGYLACLGAMGAAGLSRYAQWGFSLVVAAALLLSARFTDKRSFKDFGFAKNARWMADLGFGLGLGAFLMAGIFFLELGLGMVRISGSAAGPGSPPVGRGIGFALVVCLGVAFQEESIMRAYLMRNLAEGFTRRAPPAPGGLLAAYLLSSSVFGFLHILNPNAGLASALLLVLAGLFLGLPYFLTGELAIPLGLHFSWNFFQGPVFGFPVSGTSFGASLIALEQGGPGWFTGGAFGPEGGAAGLIAMTVGSVLVCLWIRFTRGGLKPRWDLARYMGRNASDRN